MAHPNDNLLDQNLAAADAVPRVNLGEEALHAISRFPVSITLCAILGTAGALAFGLSLPNLYKSTGMLLVRLGAQEQRSPEGAVAEDFEVRGSAVAPGDELLILSNPDLHKRVVERVGPARILQTYNPSAADNEDTPEYIRSIHRLQAWLIGLVRPRPPSLDSPVTEKMIAAAVEQVTDGVEISARRGTSIIQVAFTAQDPELAQLVVNEFLEVFQEYHRETYANDALSFINEKFAAANEEADAAESALSERQEQDGMHDPAILAGALEEELLRLRSQALQDEVMRETYRVQLATIDAQIAEHQPGPAEPTDAAEPPQRTGLELRLSQLLAQNEAARQRIDELESTYAVGSRTLDELREPQAKRIEENKVKIAEIEALLEPPPVTGRQEPRGSDLILTQLVSARLPVVQLQEAQEAGSLQRDEACATIEGQLAELRLLEPIHARLQRARDEKRQHADEWAKARDQAQVLEKIAADERMSNLKVTQPATLPTTKEGPGRAKFLALGLLGGLALGLTLAGVRQLLDSRLRYPKSIETALGIRVLGVVPELGRWRRKGRRLYRTMARQS